MAQFARPDGDVTTTGVGGGTYASIDETSASDADFIYGNEDAAVTYVCSLTNPTDPVTHTGHIFRYRIAKLNGTSVDTGGNAVYCTVTLLEGSTTIKADTQKTAGDWTTYELTLSEAEAATITDYTALRLQFVSPASGGSAATRRAIGISWAELEVPVVSYTLTCDAGSFTHTGQDAPITAARKLSCDYGPFTHTGQDVTLTYTEGGTYDLTCDTGSLTLTGQVVALARGRFLVCSMAQIYLSADPWYLAGGVSSAILSGAWVAKGAESLDASYLRIDGDEGNADIDPAVVGGSAPGWDATYGWKAGPTHYLKTGIIANSGYSYIIRYSSAASITAECLFGEYTAGSRVVYFLPIKTEDRKEYVNGANNGQGICSTHKVAGVAAMAGNKAYFDGVDMGVTLGAWSGDPAAEGIYLFRLGSAGLAMHRAYIQAFAAYKTTLTAAQIAEISIAINNQLGLLTESADDELITEGADIFLTAGQSNAAGYLTSNQSYSHATLTAIRFGKDYLAHELTDPISTNTNYVEGLQDDNSGCASKGSIWPLVATDVMASTGRQIVVAPCAVGGKGLSTFWMPGTDHEDVLTLYGCLVTRGKALQARGHSLKAVLLWCGEAEVVAGMTQANFNTYLDTFANAIMSDLGIPTIVCKLHDMPDLDETNVNAAIAEAWGDNANVLQGPDLSGITADDAYHITTTAKAESAADLWAAAINAAFGWD